MPRYRTALKWLHWLSAGFILYFFLVEPEDVEELGAVALATHSGIGALLAVVMSLWMAVYLRNGLASRPGPKLPLWGKRVHPILHRALIWVMTAAVFTGGLAGLAAPFAIKLFGAIPFFPGVGAKGPHGLITELHEIAFDALLILVVFHAGFHIWRHYRRKDRALNIMMPKAAHKFL